MKVARLLVVGFLIAVIFGVAVRAQEAPRLERLLGISTHQKPVPPPAPPQGLENHVTNGKLVLSLNDTIRLALAKTPTSAWTVPRLTLPRTISIAPRQRSIPW